MDKVISGPGNRRISTTRRVAAVAATVGAVVPGAMVAVPVAVVPVAVGKGGWWWRRRRDDIDARGATQMMRARRRPQAGMTLIEVMIAVAILVIMMSLAWKTIANTSESKKGVREVRGAQTTSCALALGRIVARLSRERLPVEERRSERRASAHHVHSRSRARRLPDIRFSTLGHRVLWADANESEQTVILVRRAQRSRARRAWSTWVRARATPAVERAARGSPGGLRRDDPRHQLRQARVLELEDRRVAGQPGTRRRADGQKGWLPSRVRITNHDQGGPTTRTTSSWTEARIWMQETLKLHDLGMTSGTTERTTMTNPGKRSKTSCSASARSAGRTRSPTRRKRDAATRRRAGRRDDRDRGSRFVISNEFGTSTNVDMMAAANYRDQMRSPLPSRASAANLVGARDSRPAADGQTCSSCAMPGSGSPTLADQVFARVSAATPRRSRRRSALTSSDAKGLGA